MYINILFAYLPTSRALHQLGFLKYFFLTCSRPFALTNGTSLNPGDWSVNGQQQVT